ncbi:MAG TPA: NAD-dependent epimerase/dehydratase family protein [Bacteroidota bacterium]|nr:NAD-dependent epimerase/dehydratase family protein [Bacteroidota bacterium]
MRILITGASGFLGKFLVEHFNGDGHEVTAPSSKTCNLTVQSSLNQFSGTKYDRIFHLAAWTQAGDFCLRHPGEQWIINQQINTNVLTWWQTAQPQAKLVSIGTSCSYSPDLPLTEENYLTGMPIDSLFTYAMTKRMLYSGMLAMNKQFGLRYLCVVPSTLYGPGYHLDGRQMHFIFDLIRKIINGKNYGEPVVLWGDGYQKRELVHVSDFVRIMLELDRQRENDIINIGAGEEHTIRDFAEIICRKVGYEFAKIRFDTTRYVGARSKMLETAKLKNDMLNLDLIPLEKGLNETIEWFMKETYKVHSRV